MNSQGLFSSFGSKFSGILNSGPMGRSLGIKIAVPLIVGALIFAFTGFVILNRIQRDAAESQAIKTAESVVSQALATRAVYTSDVVGKLRGDGANVSFASDFQAHTGAAPLPATLINRISDSVNEQGLFKFSLVSPWAINPAKLPKDKWETNAMDSLIGEPDGQQHLVDTVGGEPRLRFMGPDLISVQACATCHNNHPDSPKTDFELGDVIGGLLVEVPLESEFAAASTTAMWMSFGLAGGLAVLVGIVLLVLQVSVIRPVQKLTTASESLAEGDASVIVDIQSHDEVGKMASSFSRLVEYNREMADLSATIAEGELDVEVTPKSDRDVLGHAYVKMLTSLKSLVVHMRNGAEKLALSGGNLAELADNAASGATDITKTSQQIAEGTQEQAKSATDATEAANSLVEQASQINQATSELSSHMETAAESSDELRRAIEQIDQGVANVSKQADETMTRATEGRDLVQQTMVGMAEVANAVDSAVKQISDLGTKSDEIGNIVGVIEDIATQTNMLALNAAIEAARAGEHGRGFAVVAEEVRMLAEKVTEATAQIAGVIDSMQTGVKSSVDAAHTGTEKVTIGNDLAERTSTAITGILEIVENVSRQLGNTAEETKVVAATSTEIVKAVEQSSERAASTTSAALQMNESTRAVSEAIHSIAAVAEQNAAGSEEASATSENFKDQVDQVAAASKSLVSLSGELRTQIASFHVGDETPEGESATEANSAAMSVEEAGETAA